MGIRNPDNALLPEALVSGTSSTTTYMSQPDQRNR